MPSSLLMTAISIHAPTRGATSLGIPVAVKGIISIHAPTRGATSVFQIIINCGLFQSTLLQEERQLLIVRHL